MRAQLESIEFSFRDIEAIQTKFHDALTSIDQTLVEIERTKVANLEAERRLENLTAANDRLQRDCAGLTVERDALAVAQDELLARASDLEQTVTVGEAASSSALAVLAERSANLEQTERDLDDNRRALHALTCYTEGFSHFVTSRIVDVAGRAAMGRQRASVAAT